MKTKNVLLVLFLAFGISLSAQNKDDQKMIDGVQTVKADVLKNNPKLQRYFDDAKAYAIFPNVGKGALIIGIASGHGAVYERGTLVGMANMKQIDAGAQIGGEAYSEIIFFKTDKAIQEFMDSDLQFSSQISALALKEDATINVSYEDGVAIFTSTKGGLMAEVSIGGQKFKYTPLNK